VGLYLENEKEISKSLATKNYKLIRSKYQECPWEFVSKKDMLFFFRKLFSLKNITDKELFKKIDEYLGIVKLENERISVNFNLLFITYQQI